MPIKTQETQKMNMLEHLDKMQDNILECIDHMRDIIISDMQFHEESKSDLKKQNEWRNSSSFADLAAGLAAMRNGGFTDEQREKINKYLKEESNE